MSVFDFILGVVLKIWLLIVVIRFFIRLKEDQSEEGLLFLCPYTVLKNMMIWATIYSIRVCISTILLIVAYGSRIPINGVAFVFIDGLLLFLCTLFFSYSQANQKIMIAAMCCMLASIIAFILYYVFFYWGKVVLEDHHFNTLKLHVESLCLDVSARVCCIIALVFYYKSKRRHGQ